MAKVFLGYKYILALRWDGGQECLLHLSRRGICSL